MRPTCHTEVQWVKYEANLDQTTHQGREKEGQVNYTGIWILKFAPELA